ncbi:MAG: S8 family serine peptidase [Actinomycetota bacterium]
MSRDLKSSLLGVVAAGALVASAFVAAPAVATSSPAPVPKAEPDALTFIAALKYDRTGLLASARAISTPGGRMYRNFLTVKEAAAKFGVAKSQRDGLVAAAKKAGITVEFSATGLTANLTAPVATWTALYGAEPVSEVAGPWLLIGYADPKTELPLPVPAALRTYVREVFASEAVLLPPAPRSTARSSRVTPSADDTPPFNAGTPFGPGRECLGAGSVVGSDVIVYSPSQIHVPYGTAALHSRGLKGAGARVANLARGYTYTDSYVKLAAECFDYRAPTVRFTGGRGVGSTPIQGIGADGEGEGNLDVQVIAAVTPEASSIDFVETGLSFNVYQSFVESVDLLTTKVSPMPDVVTTSYGACELELAGLDGQRAVADDHFALLATLGVTMLAATGDGGSSACAQFVADPIAPLRAQSVEYPASSPWVTGVGGTRIVLGQGNQRVAEFPWNDTPWLGLTSGAGSGGPSVAARPWYQRPVTAEDRRLVPDIAAHASELPGWAVALGAKPGDVTDVGGTSAASPFAAANLALIAAAERKAGRGPLGFINPLLYDIASKPDLYKLVYYDVTVGNNQRFIEAACCDATKGYDQATGLGSVTFSELIKVIPKPGPGRR